MKKALVILTYNEIEALPKIWDKIPLSAADRVIAVDGGSKDGTQEFLKSKGVEVLGQPRRGRGVAFRVAAEAADADVLCYFSPDGNEDPNDIPKLFSLVEQGADVAVASRMMKGAFNEEDIHWWRPRKWVNNAFTLVANLLWNRGPYVTDTINGFRAVRRDKLLSIGCDADGFVIEYQMSIRAFKHNLKIVEIPTYEGQRLGGVSTAESWRTGVVFLKELWRQIVESRTPHG
jgi:glycosyltransferase involved in cell wall biosynthesis